ncbi:hypothetical protein [Thermophilibacter sp.]|uniref:hypothetical protein n=1 Tax=Thermophilibacter sp. TaxID=2847309 RepID=UPI003A918998
MSETLKPCPLCGSTDIACFAEECGDDYDNVPTFRAVVGCRGCHEEDCDPSYDDEPCFGIEAYFSANHPLVKDCEDPWDIERVLERHMAERWNRRAERTCRMVDNGCELCCSECDCRHDYDDEPNYCHNCGARVVGA